MRAGILPGPPVGHRSTLVARRGWQFGVPVTFVLALLGAPAHAGNEDELLVGNDAALSGGAVTASVDDGSALYYNPAGLTRVRQDSVDVTASAFVVRRYDLPALLSTPSGERARGDVTEIVSAPSALSYVRRLSPELAAGVGVFVPRTDPEKWVARVDLNAPAPGEIAAISTPPVSVSVHELSLHVGSAVYF